ncbi:efflux RND transporter periplasmic adaptor subunit [Hyphomicrobium sp. 99]|uniref:efflux RND transporter periplasmic adaptor subunit n=1 Tax=Hyphomicrobium sp. 99 TaxID=1163419 RepID=UPI0005F80DC6|nr:efflux RND transporter periplasmic adaptor subunit [Hyphomicrobium sp. 99]
MTLLRWVSTVVIVGAIAGGVYYMMHGQAPDSVSASRRGAGMGGPVAVIAKNTDRADVPIYLEGVGSVKALNTATVRAQVDGRLLSVNFNEGQDVKKGDVLAKIDPVTYQAQLDQAIAKKALDEALLANTKKDLERFQKVGTLAISQQQIDTQLALVKQQEAQIKSDAASIENATAILGYTTIVAPFDGRTGIRLVDEGNLVHSGDAGGIVVMTQVQPISVLFTLPQQQLPMLTKSSAEGKLTAYALSTDGQTELDTGTLKVIDNQVDQQTGTIRLKADFPNEKRQLWPGQFVNVRLLVDTLKGVIVAPTEAVQRGPDGTYVYVVGADNTAEMRPVKISRQDEKFAVIADGLTEGEKVVTSGFGRLKDGATVSVSDGKAPEQSPPALSKKSADGKKAARVGDAANVGVQSAQATAPAAPDAALVTGSTSEDKKNSDKHRHSHRDNGASP